MSDTISRGRPVFLLRVFSFAFWYLAAFNLPFQVWALADHPSALNVLDLVIAVAMVAWMFLTTRIVRVSIWTPFGFRF